MGFFPSTNMPDREWWSVLWPDPEGVLLELGLPRGETAVDLCSGDGYFTAPLAKLAAPGKVYALEMDPEMVSRAREYLSACGSGNCVVIEDDARNLAAYISEPVGFALIANTFHGIPEPDRRELVHQVYDTLRPGGRLAIINWHPLPREQTSVLDEHRGPPTEMRMSLKQTRAAVERPVGFSIERIVEFPPYHFGVVFTRDQQRREYPEIQDAESPLSENKSSRILGE